MNEIIECGMIYNLKLGETHVISTTRWGTRPVYVGVHHGSKTDLPSFVNGSAHVYDATTHEYLGFCGVNVFKKHCGIDD